MHASTCALCVKTGQQDSPAVVSCTHLLAHLFSSGCQHGTKCKLKRNDRQVKKNNHTTRAQHLTDHTGASTPPPKRVFPTLGGIHMCILISSGYPLAYSLVCTHVCAPPSYTPPYTAHLCDHSGFVAPSKLLQLGEVQCCCDDGCQCHCSVLRDLVSITCVLLNIHSVVFVVLVCVVHRYG